MLLRLTIYNMLYIVKTVFSSFFFFALILGRVGRSGTLTPINSIPGLLFS